MKKFTRVLLLVAALFWLPADWLMTGAVAQTTPVPTDETTDPATIRMQKRIEAMQRRTELLAARTGTNTTAAQKSLLNAPQGKWEPRAPLPPGPRERAFNFVIGDKFYVGTGRSYRGWAAFSTNEDDVWAYDFATDSWEELSPFPGGAIRNAASFVIDGIAYIATGHNGSTYLDIFWKYDPATDTWEELPPFPGGVRSFPVAFAVNGKGYVALGGIGNEVPAAQRFYYNDLWEYDPAIETWTQLADFPSQGRWRSFAFVIDGQAYVGGGNRESTNSADFSDCYRFNPADGSWTPVADFPEGYGLGTYAVVIDEKAYVGEGGNHDYFEAYRTKLWEYDPGADAWTHVSYTPGPQLGRVLTYSAAYGGKLYVGGGRIYSWAAGLSQFFGDFHVWDKDADPEAPAYEYWESLGRGDVDEDFIGIHGIQAITEDTIWALPTATFTDWNAPLQVMLTSDGGGAWETFTVDDERGYNFAHFYAADARRLWVIGTLSNGHTNVFRTQDGGQTWEKLLDGEDNLMNESNGIHFFDDEVGLCWGNDFYNDLRLFVYRTTDGGATWEQLDDPALPGSSSFDWSFTTSGNNNYAAVGDAIWIPVDFITIRSTDRGATWERTDYDVFDGSTYSIAFEDGQRGMTICDNWPGVIGARGFVTEDGGATWTEIPIPLPTVVSITHIPGSPGAYVAYSTIMWDPRIAYTPNFGQDWVEIYAPPALHAIQFLSQDVAFAGGPLLRDVPEGVYRWRGDLSVYNRLYVKADATGNNTGRSWANAFTDLQSALAVAAPDDEIWVAQGTYTPAGPDGARTATYLIDKELRLYGGFAGTETRLEERGDPADHPTILSGDLNGDDVDGNFVSNRSDNVYTIVSVGLGITERTLIDGFILRGGHADGPGFGPDINGGGLRTQGKPIIQHCIFEYNYAQRTGAGMVFANANAGGEVRGCTFRNNRANNGGGFGSYSADYLIEGCTFEGNSTFTLAIQANGGGIYLENGNGTVRDCHFVNNSAVANGGGIFVWSTTASNGLTAEISGCTFQGNTAAAGGGLTLAPWGDNAVYSIADCQFANNESDNGGGLYAIVNVNAENFQFSLSDSDFTGNSGSAASLITRASNTGIEIRNCSFIENHEEGYYPPLGIWSNANATGAALIDNCHFENNSSFYSGAMELGAGFNGVSNFSFTVTNSRFIGNEATETGALTIWNDQNSTAVFLLENCLFDGNYADITGGAITPLPHGTNFRADIKRCVFINNESLEGSAITSLQFSPGPVFPQNARLHIENSLFAGNTGSTATIVAETMPNLSLLNCTVAGNNDGGVLIRDQSGLRLQNTILYNPGFEEYASSGSGNSFTSAGGNLIGDLSLDGQLVPGDKQNLDPLFEGAGSYQLTMSSPCVDAGTNAGVTAEFDLAGNPRIQGLRVDMGAYESPFTTSTTETASAEAVLWPNPATDVLNVVLPDSETASFDVQVFDAAGQILLRRRLWPGQALPLHGLAPGMYSLKATTAERVYTGKFIKQ